MNTSDKLSSRKRRRLCGLLVATAFLLSGCGNTKRIDGVEYDVYGFGNYQEKQNPNIEYKVSVDSVICAVIFFETIIVPLYVVLFDLYEPVQKMPTIKGQIG